MREEISEPKHWRTRTAPSQSWSVRRRDAALSTEAVDAVFDAEQPLPTSELAEPTTYPELVSRIHEQLAVLEAQRVQLQLLLSQADDKPS
jgi:hypothetical protein